MNTNAETPKSRQMRNKCSFAKLGVVAFAVGLALAAMPDDAGATSNGVEVTVVNQVAKSQVCIAESNTLTVFTTASNQQNLAPNESSKAFQAPYLFGSNNLGFWSYCS